MPASLHESTGTLWLIPMPIDPSTSLVQVLPAETLNALKNLKNFFVENAKTARSFLKQLNMPIQSLQLVELKKNCQETLSQEILSLLLSGTDFGLLSESGCPAVADPGASLVAAAHSAGARIRPLVGPSSILLALMGSGLNGQRFSFCGYIPVNPIERSEKLRYLEERSKREDETILFIETPYRNQALVHTALKTLSAATQLLIATGLTSPEESIQTRPISGWKKHPPALKKTPTVFGIYLAPKSSRRNP